MKKTINKSPITAKPVLNDYWDVEDRLYEQQKEMKIDNILDEPLGD